MEDIYNRLRRLSSTYKMYADSALKCAKEYQLRFMVYNKNDDLQFSKEQEIVAGKYWSFHNEVELILEKYDKPIDYSI